MKNVSTGMNVPSMDKLMNRMFRKVDSVVWDIMTGKLGIKTKDGIATLDGEGDEAQVNVNMFEDFGLAVPAFAQSTPMAAVAVGDLIYTNGETPGWIVQKNEKAGKVSFLIMRPGGTINTWNPPKIQMFGLDGGVLVVRSLLTMLPGGSSSLLGMQQMIMPMLFMGGDVDFEKMMPLMLMSQVGMGAGAVGADPAVANNGMANMMQTVMMMNMMKSMGGGSGSSGGNSPFRG